MRKETKQICGCVSAVALVVSNSVTSWTVVLQAPLSMGFSRHTDASGS